MLQGDSGADVMVGGWTAGLFPGFLACMGYEFAFVVLLSFCFPSVEEFNDGI